MDLAAQILAALARARQARELAELIGASALSETDRCFIEFERSFRHRLLAQQPDENRELEETMERAWQALSTLPRHELTMIEPAELEARLPDDDHRGGTR
jgi:V/A-type H+-transporting ATPase subunit B